MLSEATGSRQGSSSGLLQPLGVLHRHRGRDHRERLVGREQPVAAGEQVALEPALAVVLAEHLHHAAVGRDVVVDVEIVWPTKQRFSTSKTSPRRLELRLVGAEEAEVGLPCALLDEDVAQQLAQLAGGLVRARWQVLVTSSA